MIKAEKKGIEKKVYPLMHVEADNFGVGIPLTLMCDSGATISVVPKKLLQRFPHKITKVTGQIFRAANGEIIGNDQRATFSVALTGKPHAKIEIRDALIITGEHIPTDMCLLGTPDLSREKVDLLFSDNSIRMPRYKIKMNMKFASICNIEAIQSNSEISNVAVKSLALPKTADMIENQPDSRAAYKRLREIQHQKMKETSTIGDVKFDEEFCRQNPGLKEKCIALLKKYPTVSQSDTGCLSTSKWAVNAQISGKCMKPNPRKTQALRKYSAQENAAIIKKMDEDYANGVLVFPEDHKIPPLNVLNILVVRKKDGNGKVIAFDHDVRCVLTCDQRINKITKIPALETDNLDEISQKAAAASKDPFKCKFDIKSAFSHVPMEKKLWGYFWILHPTQGYMVLTRCCMGWVGSMGLVRNVFQAIFSKFDHCMYRYMDDGFLHAPTETEFLKVFDQFLKCLEFNNLRIKGSKLEMFSKKIVFLGVALEGGKIYPSPHSNVKALAYNYTDIKTISQLRTYLGLVQFLAKFMHRSVDTLYGLRRLVGKEGQEKVPWEENGGILIKDFSEAKKRLGKLCELTAFNSKQPAYVFVDSSGKGQGAILAQKNDKQEFQIVQFYSRKRADSERLTPASSCELEIGGMTGGLNAFRKYLEDSPFPVTVFSDSKSLVAICQRFANNQIPTDITLINKFFRDLLGLRLRVVYLAGKDIHMGAVDLLSRMEAPNCNPKDCKICKIAQIEHTDDVIFVRQISGLCTHLNCLFKNDPETPIMTVETVSNVIDEKLRYKLKWHKQKLNAFAVNSVVAPVARGLFEKITVKGLLADTNYLQELQDRDPLIRKALQILRDNEQIPPAKSKYGARLHTLLNVKEAYVSKGLIVYIKFVPKLGTHTQIVLIPKTAANIACKAIHNEFGCKSPTQFYNMFERYFEMENARAFIETFLRQCATCLLLRRENAKAPLVLKETTPPQYVGEVIFCDEITRQGRNGDAIKLLVSTDALSRFAFVNRYKDWLTSEKFVRMMSQSILVLGSLGCKSGTSTIIIRTDGATAHTSAETHKAFEKIGVALEVHQSTTCSKNLIPAQDARIKAIQRFLTVALNNPNWSSDEAIFEATKMYNQSLTNLGFAAAELFTRRRLGGQSEIGISDAEIRERLIDTRKTNRDTADRRNEAKKKAQRLTFVPYDTFKAGQIHKDTLALKVGDQIKLHKKYDKTDLNRLWTIRTLNWPENTFTAKKSNMEGNRGKLKTFNMDAIDQLKTDYQTLGYIGFLSEQQRRKRKFIKLFRPFDKTIDQEFDIIPSFSGEKLELDESGFGDTIKNYPEMQESENTILNKITSEYFSDPMAASTPMPNPTYEEETLQEAENTEVSDLAHLAVKGTENNPWLDTTQDSEQFHSLLGDLEGNSSETIGKLNSTEIEMVTPESNESLPKLESTPKASPKANHSFSQARKSKRIKKKPERYGENALFGIFD